MGIFRRGVGTMKKFGRNIIEFLPYITLLYIWFFACFLGSLTVQNRPGITALGFITVPAIALIIFAMIKTYRELPETGTAPGYIDKGGARSPGFNMKFALISFGIVILITIFSTYLQYSQPQVLSVPSNTDVSTWQHPAFEETTLYERMIPAERENLLSEGVPGHAGLNGRFIGDIVTIIIGSLCFIHALKHYGFWMASCFLLGSFVFTGLQETMWILLGRLVFGGNIHNMIGGMFYGTYWFTKGGFWFIQCPFTVCIAWFYIAYTCVLVAGKIFPNINLYLRAAVGGFIAMNLDMWIDPVATSPEVMSWVWGRGDVFMFFGIPFYNFWAWFLIIAVFAVIWEKLPLMREKWGLLKASINFCLIILVTDVAVLGVIFSYHVVIGGIFALLGVEQAIQFPTTGW
jgi:hypothetical protein